MNSNLVASALFAAAALLSPVQATADAATDTISKSLGIEPANVRPSPIAGLYEIQHQREFAYVTADGRYLLRGDLVDLKSGEELTENRRRVDRLDVLAKLGSKKFIEFAPPPPVVAKYTVTVFTDIDCGYCRKLHSEIAQYNAKGIAIRYAFYPRSGPDTDAWRSAEAVWCAADQHKALTDAKAGAEVKIKGKVCDNPIAEEYQLAQDLGIRGTPMMVLPNGDVYPGYVPAAQLAAKLAESGVKPKAPVKG
ncbi:thioredoxin fold domain-containing protein [Nevskia sp.]|uniref:thioredoxin fold domain-containing protein n=1 Tax=Nevskia sp. TaxID=1929292 RepID=UPI0025CCC48F|nr:thioredoxin fold domain-containing protein [Nevskia sp.]